jgi:putative flippase GtrA
VVLVLATAVSFAASVVVNYSLNHVWSFDAGRLSWRRLSRYGVLVAVNLALTLALVGGLTELGVFYLVAKGIAVVLGAVINFTGYRYWVFSETRRRPLSQVSTETASAAA